VKRHSILNGIALDVNNQDLAMSDGVGILSFTLGEGEKLADLVGVLSKMKGLPVFPPVIRTSPFTTTIEQNDITIKHNSRNGSITTAWQQLDNFVEAVYGIIAMAKDMAVLGGDKAQNMSSGFNNSLNH
jgi:hypothetical protein